MLVVKITAHPPNAFPVLLSKGIPIWITDNFQNCFANDLKSVALQRCREIIIRYRDILARAFWKLRLCGDDR